MLCFWDPKENLIVKTFSYLTVNLCGNVKSTLDFLARWFFVKMEKYVPAVDAVMEISHLLF